MEKVTIKIEEIQSKFEKLNIFKNIKNDRLKEIVREIIDIATPLLNSINGEFKEYTMHDIEHSYRVAHYMDIMALGNDEKSIEKNLKDFSDLEFALMIISAVLHDIGMYYTNDEKNEIITSNQIYLQKLTYKGILKAKKNKDSTITEDSVLHELIRRMHHIRVQEFINKNDLISNLLKLKGEYSFKDDVGKICQSHGEDFSFLKSLDCDNVCGEYHYDSRYIATLLRLSDLLDIDHQRTPILWYRLNKPKGYSKLEWEKHFIISNDIKIFESEDRLKISFYGKSESPEIHRMYLQYIDDLRKELINACDLTDEDDFHNFNVNSKIEDKVKTIGFDYVDLRLNLDYNSITDLLMGINIYQDKRLGLRELIQNSIDACKLRQEKEENTLIKPYKPNIIIEISKKNNYVKLLDNGTGMDYNIIKSYFLNVGISYYTSEEFLFNNFNYKPIGKFGIGFLACYLLSNKVIVNSKHYLGAESIQIELEKGSEYVVTRRGTEKAEIGTDIVLTYDDFFNVFKDIDDLKQFISTYFFTNIPILIIDSDIDPCNAIKYKSLHEETKDIEFSNQKSVFIDNINCEDFDDNLQGNIIVQYPGFGITENSYNNLSNAYLFDKTSNRFLLKNINEISNRVYIEFDYPILNEIDIKNLSCKKNLKKDENYIALAKSKNSMMKFFIPSEIDISIFLNKIKINDIELKEILNQSGINYIELDFKKTCLRNKIYKYKSKGLVLHELNVSKYFNSVDIVENELIHNMTALYYRDIFIRNIYFVMSCPFNVQILSFCINNLDTLNKLTLNVSRQNFIDIRPYLARIQSIILSSFENSYYKYEANNKNEILDDYLQKRKNDLRKIFE